MERKDVVISQADLDRQREFEQKIRAMFEGREAHPRACVDTFGCQQNVADGQKLMGMLETMGFTFTDEPAEADLVMLNTCAVREHAEDRVFGNLGALTHTKKANPEQVIALCGCMAQEARVSERVKRSYPHVNLVFGPHALWKFPELLWQVYDSRRRVFSVADEHGTISEGLPIVREDAIKAWVSIMALVTSVLPMPRWAGHWRRVRKRYHAATLRKWLGFINPLRVTMPCRSESGSQAKLRSKRSCRSSRRLMTLPTSAPVASLRPRALAVFSSTS